MSTWTDPPRPLISVDGPWTKDMERRLLSGEADGVGIAYALGKDPRDLSFLTGLPIRKLAINQRAFKGIEPIYSLAPTLEVLWLDVHPDVTIDVSRLPGLRVLSASWRQVRASLLSLTGLRDLSMSWYEREDLSELAQFKDLEVLSLVGGRVMRSLDGLEHLSRLRIFVGALLSGLRDIDALGRGGSGNITRLELETCKRVGDLSALSALRQLEVLCVPNSGDIASVAPLEGLPRLARIYMPESTRIVDGDLGPLQRLPALRHLALRSRRHYTPPVEEIEAMLAERAAAAERG